MNQIILKISLSNRFFNLYYRILLALIVFSCRHNMAEESPAFNPAKFRHYVDAFNQNDAENVVNFIPNAKSWQWMLDNIPFFECPDTSFEQTYYYRWWTFRKHLKQTPQGFVFTEFITPVRHAGEYNTISCALGHHIMEGRWLIDNNPRSRFYNHSTFCDLVISGLVGLIPRADDTIEFHPLVPPKSWKWFALDQINYHGHSVSIFWDETGDKYQNGKGLFIYSDGKLIAHSHTLQKIRGPL